LLAVVTGLVCLAGALTWWRLAKRQAGMIRSDTEQRFQMLTKRLHAIESRIEKLGSFGLRALDDHAKSTLQSVPGGTNQGRRKKTLLDLGTAQGGSEELPLISIPDLGTDSDEPGGRVVGDLDALHGSAWTLAAAGVSPQEIARQTGQPIGQIELIVGLYRRLHSTRGSNGHARPH
jgi:hypothetical protein